MRNLPWSDGQRRSAGGDFRRQRIARNSKPQKTVGSYWPYATTLWDYINRAMPFDHPSTLTPDEVYSATAYVLFLNGVVGEQDWLDETTLPKVQMPNRNGFVADPRPDIPLKRK